MSHFDEIRAQLEKATPGPWEVIKRDWNVIIKAIQCFTCNGKPETIVAFNHHPDYRFVAVNADLIAHAPTDLAYLLTRLAAAERVVDIAKKLLIKWDDGAAMPIDWDLLRDLLHAYQDAA